MLPRLTLKRAKDLLDTYTLNQLLEDNGLSEEEVLVFLVEQGLLELPETQPL